MGTDTSLQAADGFTLGAYMAQPQAAARGGVVVVQEIFGVNGHIRAVCDRFAEADYLAVAPAIFDRVERGVQLGYTPEDIARGRAIRGQCDMDKVLQDLAAAAEVAATAGKVGIVGYCWGGLLTYRAACRLGDRFACAASYYGANIVSYLGEKPAVPMQLHFGALDASIPATEIAQIRAAHPALSVHVYDGADHGFNCNQRRQYNPVAARLAQKRTLDLFATHLR